MDPIGPSSGALAVAGLATAVLVVVAAAVYVRLVAAAGAGAPSTPWARLAATATAAIGAGSALVLVVLWAAAEKARRFGAPPYVATEPFASLLVDVRTIVDITPGNRAQYATVVLLPLTLTAAVLAAGLVRDARSATVRLLTGALAGVCLAGATAASFGESGRLVAPLALGLAVLALVAVAGLVLDELRRGQARVTRLVRHHGGTAVVVDPVRLAVALDPAGADLLEAVGGVDTAGAVAPHRGGIGVPDPAPFVALEADVAIGVDPAAVAAAYSTPGWRTPIVAVDPSAPLERRLRAAASAVGAAGDPEAPLLALDAAVAAAVGRVGGRRVVLVVRHGTGRFAVVVPAVDARSAGSAVLADVGLLPPAGAQPSGTPDARGEVAVPAGGIDLADAELVVVIDSTGSSRPDGVAPLLFELLGDVATDRARAGSARLAGPAWSADGLCARRSVLADLESWLGALAEVRRPGTLVP